MTWLKNNFLALVILVFAIIIYFQRCGNKPDTQVTRRDTTFSVQYVPQPQQIIPQYQPVIIESKQPAVIPQQFQPSTDPNVVIKQYQDLVDKFLAQNHYRDSISLKDSSGHYVGSVQTNDVVSENQIKTRDFTYKLSFPQVARTITVNEPYKPKGQLYIGGGINGSPTSLIQSFDLGAVWKNKKDQLFGIKAGISKEGINYGVSSYWKIKFGK